MEKNKLLLFPLLVGIILMVYSWYLSYPLSIDSVQDSVFNHVSIFYWVSLSLVLTSMYMIAITFKSDSLKWIMVVGIVLTMYSLSYFYYFLPGSDSRYIRGLTEYFSATKNLNPSQLGKMYFQWPSFFILADVTSSISGLTLPNVEFLGYAIICFLIVTPLYKFFLKTYKNGGFLAVIAFFIVMFNYLNFQFVPYSLAFGFLLLLFMLENRQRNFSRGLTIAELVLFTSISITHAIVPFFFILFLLVRYILTRNKRYGKLCILSSIIYLIAQFTLAPTAFADNILSMITKPPTEYAGLVRVVSVSAPIDALAQKFSITVTIVGGVICVAGFIILLTKRRMRDLDKAIFLTGILYAGLGVVFSNLGQRAFPLIFIPLSFGVSYLFESRFRPFLKCLFLVLLMLFLFVPLHLSFYSTDAHDIQFQTNEAYKAENFLVSHYNWNSFSVILADFRVNTYLESKTTGNTSFTDDAMKSNETDAIFYNIGLGLYLSDDNLTMEKILYEKKLDVTYQNGLSSIAIRSAGSKPPS